MPKYTYGNYKWLGSEYGTEHPQTVTLKISEFSGVTSLASGTPLKDLGEGYMGKGATDGSAAPDAFLFSDVSFKDGDGTGVAVAAIFRGDIRTQHLPVDSFTVPSDPGRFRYVGGN